MLVHIPVHYNNVLVQPDTAVLSWQEYFKDISSFEALFIHGVDHFLHFLHNDPMACKNNMQLELV